MLTVNSGVENISASGVERVDVTTADESALTAISGITPEIAKAIIAYRSQNRDKLKGLADLLDVTAPQTQSVPRLGRGSSSGNSDTSGPKVISEDLLLRIADSLKFGDKDPEGQININSASREVLMCLAGVSRELAQSIISYRESTGYLDNVAYLLKVPGMNRDTFKAIAPLVCVRSETYRILSEGVVSSTGAKKRIEEIVRINVNTVKTLSYREDDL
jgi:competence ComEA-like helix-hairpin-helix protein